MYFWKIFTMKMISIDAVDILGRNVLKDADV